MAIYHCSIRIISRGKGKSSVAAAAYRSGTKLIHVKTDPASGKQINVICDYSSKVGVVYSNIFVPDEFAPNEFVPEEFSLSNSNTKVAWIFDRAKLWQKVEDTETRGNSRLAREFEIALPVELNQEQNILLTEEFIKNSLVTRGMVADVNIHYDNPENPHVHIMTTTRMLVELENREITFGAKNTDWDKKEILQLVRSELADIINKHLHLHGFDSRVSHLSYKELGIDLTPGVHEGPARYIESAQLAAKNHQIKIENAKLIEQHPELVLGKLSISKPVFTKDDLSNALTKTLNTGIANKFIDIDSTKTSKEFLAAFGKLMDSDKLTTILEHDLQGHSLYCRTDRLKLEQSYIKKIKQLSSSNNHSLNINNDDLDKLDLGSNIAQNNSVFGKIGQFVNRLDNFSFRKKIFTDEVTVTDLSLNQEQKKAITNILTGSDISILEGLPGSGKTTAMMGLVDQYKKFGYKVIGVAPSSSAALQLAAYTGIESRNADLWRKKWLEANGKKFELVLRNSYSEEELYQNNKVQLANKHVMIIDEASMAGLNNMDYLIGQAQKAGAKIILVGDNNQFSSVGAAGAFKKAISICGSETLEQTRRQLNPEHAKATKLLSEFKVREALDIYTRNDCIVIADNKLDRDNKLVRDYIDAYLDKDSANANSIVGCTYTNEAAASLNKKLRTQLKLAGIIKGKGVHVNITGKSMELCRGEQIVFARNLNYAGKSGIYNGEIGTVLSVSTIDDFGNSKIKVLVKKSDSRKEKVTIDTSRYNSISNKGQNKLLDYGYAVTAYKLQGATVDQTFVLYERQVGYEAFNVMMTRHRNNVKLYADRESLLDNIYQRLDPNIEKARTYYKIENTDKDSALIGLNISINKRVNNSFAEDYRQIGLRKEDKLIKEYLTLNKNTIDLIRRINSTASSESSEQKELWNEFIKTKDQRNNLARSIVDNYELYKNLTSQLNINYATLEKQAYGLNNYKLSEKSSKLYYSSNNYKNLISAIESGSVDRTKSSHKALVQEILENNTNLALAKNKLKDLENRVSEIKGAISNEVHYREKLLPEYLKQIYNNPTEEVIDKWQELSKLNGQFMAAEMITRNPAIIGKIKGVGFGKWIGFNDKRIDAITTAENLGKRLRQYDASTEIEANLKSELTKLDYNKSKTQLENEINTLTLLAPSKLDQEFIDKYEAIIINLKQNETTISDIDTSVIAKSDIFEAIKLNYLQEQLEYGDSKSYRKNNQNTISNNNAKSNYDNYSNNYKILFSEVKSALTPFNIESIFRDYVHAINPNGKIIKKGNNISCGSLNMNLKLGIWNRFSTDQKGDIFAFVREATACNIKESLEIVASTVGITSNSNQLKSDAITHSKQLQTDHTKQTIKKAEKNAPQVPVDEWIAYDKVPNTAEKFDYNKHLKFMKKEFELQAIYPYLNNKSELLGYTVRLVNKSDGKKQVLPVTYCYNEVRKQSRWQLKGFTDNSYKPIYGAQQLGTEKNILLVEGEKTADSTKKLLPEYTILSWLGGVAAVDKVNWNLLQDKNVVIWPDNDNAGKNAAKNIISILNQINGYNGRVSIVDTDELNLPAKWDLADQLPENLQKSKVQQIITDTIKQTQNKHKTLLKQWQNQLSSKDAINYMEYATAYGKDEYEHEFLTLKDALYRDTLVIIAANSNLKPEFEQETSSIKENLRKIQDLYRKKIGQYEGHTISNRNLSNLSELEQKLIRDITIFHQQKLQTNNLANCHKAKIVSTVKDIVKDYKSKLKNKDQAIQISDKQKIAKNLYKFITDKTWLKELDKAKAFEKEQVRIIDSINKEIRQFQQYGFVKRGGIKFTSSISYLKYLKNDKQLGPYLKNTDFMTQLDRVKLHNAQITKEL